MKKIKKNIVLTLINDERKNKHVLSAKGCNGLYYDSKNCVNGAEDICPQKDDYACIGEHASDYCKYIDRSICEGPIVTDMCNYDYDDCSYNGYDTCGYDF